MSDGDWFLLAYITVPWLVVLLLLPANRNAGKPSSERWETHLRRGSDGL